MTGKIGYGVYPILSLQLCCNSKTVLKSCFAFLAVLRGTWDLSFPTKRSNPCPLQWKHRILTTGPPGKSSKVYFLKA